MTSRGSRPQGREHSPRRPRCMSSPSFSNILVVKGSTPRYDPQYSCLHRETSYVCWQAYTTNSGTQIPFPKDEIPFPPRAILFAVPGTNPVEYLHLVPTRTYCSSKLVHREVGFEPQLRVYHFHKSGILLFVGGSSCVKNRGFQDGIGLQSCTARVPREERPARSQGQDPHRRGKEGEGEGQDCRMAPGEPEGKVSIAALPTLERFVCSGSGQKRWRRSRRRCQNSRAVEKWYAENATSPGWCPSSPPPLLAKSRPSWLSKFEERRRLVALKSRSWRPRPSCIDTASTTR